MIYSIFFWVMMAMALLLSMTWAVGFGIAILMPKKEHKMQRMILQVTEFSMAFALIMAVSVIFLELIK